MTRFKRSTQHLNDGGAFDGTTTRLGGSVDGAGGDTVTGSAPRYVGISERAFWMQIAAGLTSEGGGLLAARVLSEFYETVTIVEHHELPDNPLQHKGIDPVHMMVTNE